MERPNRDNLDPLALHDYIDHIEKQLENDRTKHNRLFDKVNCFTIDLNPEIDEYDNGYNQALENLGNLLKEFLTQNQSKDE